MKERKEKRSHLVSRRVHNSYRIKDTTKRMYYWRSRSTDYCWLTKLILRDSLQDHTVVFRFYSKITADRTSREGSNGVSELEREIQSSRANMVQFLNFRKDSTEKTHCAKQRFCRKSAYREHAAISVTLYSDHVEKMKKEKRRHRIWWAYESIIHTESQIRPNEGQYGRKRVTARRRKLSEGAKIGVSEVQQLHLLKYGTISENPNATTLASRAAS